MWFNGTNHNVNTKDRYIINADHSLSINSLQISDAGRFLLHVQVNTEMPFNYRNNSYQLHVQGNLAIRRKKLVPCHKSLQCCLKPPTPILKFLCQTHPQVQLKIPHPLWYATPIAYHSFFFFRATCSQQSGTCYHTDRAVSERHSSSANHMQYPRLP